MRNIGRMTIILLMGVNEAEHIAWCLMKLHLYYNIVGSQAAMILCDTPDGPSENLNKKNAEYKLLAYTLHHKDLLSDPTNAMKIK